MLRVEESLRMRDCVKSHERRIGIKSSSGRNSRRDSELNTFHTVVDFKLVVNRRFLPIE